MPVPVDTSRKSEHSPNLTVYCHDVVRDDGVPHCHRVDTGLHPVKRFIGLDIETTGLNPDTGCRVIQIALALDNGVTIVHDVRPNGLIAYEPEAMVINGFTVARIEAANDPHTVLIRTLYQLRQHVKDDDELIAVGFNVGSFDLRFLREDYFQALVARFSHRCVDLTAFTMLMSVQEMRTHADVKEELRARIEPVMLNKYRLNPQWHDAGYDAMAALETFRYLSDCARFDHGRR